MGAECSEICVNPANDRTRLLLSTSQHDWVRRMDMKKYSKYKLNPDQIGSREYCVIHDDKQYERGIVFTDGCLYEGTIIQEKAEGVGTERFYSESQDEHQCRFHGEFLQNMWHGIGTYEDSHIIFRGRWQRGYPTQGQLQVKVKNPLDKSTIFKIKSLQLDKSYQAGTIDMELPDQSHYQGQIVRKQNNQYCFEGRGVLRLPNQDKYQGVFMNGRFEGEGVYYFGGQKLRRFEGRYRRGVKEGLGRLYIEENRYIEGKWAKNMKEGTFKLFHISNDRKKTSIDEYFFTKDKPEQESWPTIVAE